MRIKTLSSLQQRYSSNPKLSSLRCKTRSKLYVIFRKLVRQRNWNEASGVLASLLKGTGDDQSPQNIRLKYWATLEILQYIECQNISNIKIRNIYDAWMRKTISKRSFHIRVRYAVQMDFIIFSLLGGNIEDAHQILLCLTRERNLGDDALSNMVMGLTFYELWYSSIPKEFQLSFCGESKKNMEVDLSEPHVYFCNEISEEHNKIISYEGNINVEKCFELEMSSQSSNLLYDSLLAGNVWDSYLLPLQAPHSKEALEQFISLGDEMFDYRHKNALKYLRCALHLTPPSWSALLPFIQLLLLAGRVEEALHEIETLSKSSNLLLLFRIKAGILEAVGGDNLTKLSACYEEILSIDPTCGYTLDRLITMHENGDYSTNSLLEMIALHLDAVFANPSIWRQLSLCFLKMSVCVDGISNGTSGTGTTPTTPVYERSLQTTWPLRRRWWLTRHFNKSILDSEIRSGDWEMMVYKAACASHIYGDSTIYVNQTEAYLKRNSSQQQELEELVSFLKTHTTCIHKPVCFWRW